MEDLPKPLVLLHRSLSREAVSLALCSQLTQALRQAQSQLSFVRQDAYAQISALLEEHMCDASRASVVLEALLQASCWDLVLASLRTALESGTDGGSNPAALLPHATAEQELVALLSVVQVTCMVHPLAKQSLCDNDIIRLFLQRLPMAQPALACACLDTLLSLQLNFPPAFRQLVELRGIQQVSELIQNPNTPDKVKAWGARFLNLTLTHLAPALMEESPLLPSDGGGSSREAVQQSLEAAKKGVEEVLGRDAAALLMRKVSLQEGAAESKLEQLGQALSFFLAQ